MGRDDLPHQSQRWGAVANPNKLRANNEVPGDIRSTPAIEAAPAREKALLSGQRSSTKNRKADPGHATNPLMSRCSVQDYRIWQV